MYGIIKKVFAAPTDVKPIIYLAFLIQTILALHIFRARKKKIFTRNVDKSRPFFFAESNTRCFSSRDLCSLFE